MFKDKLTNAINKVELEKVKTTQELDALEKDFQNQKLNPYGITSIDFSKRQELSADILKMEGTVMGLMLAKELYDESNAQ